ncbi:hypothetical protein BH09ACT10_BH09ACT10_06030 [soil metagenome]
MRKVLLGLGAMALLTAGVVAIGWRYTSIGADTNPWESARLIDANTLQVTYGEGSCVDRRFAETEEDSTMVSITIRTRTVTTACDDALNPQQLNVNLDNPLGSRIVVDGSCTKTPEKCARPIVGQR